MDSCQEIVFYAAQRPTPFRLSRVQRGVGVSTDCAGHHAADATTTTQRWRAVAR